MLPPIIVPVEKLGAEPYASVLCFPNPSEKEVQSRIQELRGLGVTALEFSGKASVFGVKVPVLGKGFVGIVVIAHVNGKRVAIKILRQDGGRVDLLHEAKMLSKANLLSVGPRLIAASKNFILMQLIDGSIFPNWLETNPDPSAIRRVLREALEQCFRLDQAGLDHGELNKAPKHLLIDQAGKPFILDFETASIERRTANVTSICQYLFAGSSSVAKVLAEIFVELNRNNLLDALKNYKKNRTRENFERILQICFP
jgi:putative serine/threonine protein kinase